MSTHPRWSPLGTDHAVQPPCLLLGWSAGSIFASRQPREFPPRPPGKSLLWFSAGVLIDESAERRCTAVLGLPPLACCWWTPLPGRKAWPVKGLACGAPRLGCEDGHEAVAEIGVQSTGCCSRPLLPETLSHSSAVVLS